jgi:hypothetical protein
VKYFLVEVLKYLYLEFLFLNFLYFATKITWFNKELQFKLQIQEESFEYNAFNQTMMEPIHVGYYQNHFCPLLPVKANSIIKKPLIN